MRTLLAGLILSALAAPAAADMVPPPAPAYDDGYAQPYVPPAPAYAAAYSYQGAHPIAYDQGGGFCQHGGLHQHPYPAFDEHLFQATNNTYTFIGDPADFGYGGQTYAYAGAHPISGGNCHMEWGHRHLYAPVGLGYVMRGGAYAYGGPFSRSYYAQRPRYVNYYNGYYRQNYYGGRYYSARPRHIYIGRPFAPAYGGPRPGHYGPGRAYPVRHGHPGGGHRGGGWRAY